ncbi:hypothetical protein KR51_00008780 [Rubidibacter lacunae KORDI 51-2]|uniref:Uncharacterized protein n=1 Tax=Rubidibacter lacunae KORDI 51-2 TaxID=582515 RepID=U5DSA3_9CHRO|nr:hypothetical protein KR51_00008780 [Rubidibacter lacunae KORDI 51-2]
MLLPTASDLTSGLLLVKGAISAPRNYLPYLNLQMRMLQELLSSDSDSILADWV